MTKRYGIAVAAGVAGIALFATGCGSAEASGAGITTWSLPYAYTPLTSYPDRVIVYRPAMLDTGLTVDDVPQWPGPDPSEFLENPPAGGITSGESGTLTGNDAHTVYRAARNRDVLLQEGQDPIDVTDALWAVDGDVQWLVVAPQEVASRR